MNPTLLPLVLDLLEYTVPARSASQAYSKHGAVEWWWPTLRSSPECSGRVRPHLHDRGGRQDSQEEPGDLPAAGTSREDMMIGDLLQQLQSS
jgi:hypothetical protein